MNFPWLKLDGRHLNLDQVGLVEWEAAREEGGGEAALVFFSGPGTTPDLDDPDLILTGPDAALLRAHLDAIAVRVAAGA